MEYTGKILFTATVDRHILAFHVPHLKWFKEKGYEVHVASNGNSTIPFIDVKYSIPFERSPFKLANIKAYLKLKDLIRRNDYDLIHCHTPVGSVLTRLAAKDVRRRGTKVLYTAHGFHFYKGAPTINWLLYYPVEKWLAKYTDCLITINDEDYDCAVSRGFGAGIIRKVSGVGVDLKKFVASTPGEKKRLRKHYGFQDEDFILINVAELNYNKHQDLLIEAVSILRDQIPGIKLLLVGDGILSKKYKARVNKLNLQECIMFLGYRKDIPNLLALADVFISASRREGLPVSVIEAMATGLPLVVSNCRGHRDLVRSGINGCVVGINDVGGFARSIKALHKSKTLREKFAQNSLELVNGYSLEAVLTELCAIYKQHLQEYRHRWCARR